MGTRPSLKDVAARADVSVATVSHVLNNTRRVASHTRERVLKAVEELHYVRDESARQLRLGASELLGVLIVDYNPFFTDIVRGVEQAADKLGWKLIVASTGEDWNAQKELLNALISRRVEGILLAPVAGADKKDLLPFTHGNIPLVFIDRVVNGCTIPAVTSTNTYGAQVAVEHLIEHGYQKIGIVNGSTLVSSMSDREQGYYDALRNAGLSLNPDWVVNCNALASGGYEAMNLLLDRVPDMEAVFIANNLMLLGALRAIEERELKMPDDIALVSFDYQPWVDLFKPSITYVSQPAEKIGQLAVDLLLAQRDGEPMAGMMLRTALHIGESCGCKKTTKVT